MGPRERQDNREPHTATPHHRMCRTQWTPKTGRLGLPGSQLEDFSRDVGFEGCVGVFLRAPGAGRGRERKPHSLLQNTNINQDGSKSSVMVELGSVPRGPVRDTSQGWGYAKKQCIWNSEACIEGLKPTLGLTSQGPGNLDHGSVRVLAPGSNAMPVLLRKAILGGAEKVLLDSGGLSWQWGWERVLLVLPSALKCHCH